ncbi:MAG: hypothetical protein U0610_17820 [bacterium]
MPNEAPAPSASAQPQRGALLSTIAVLLGLQAISHLTMFALHMWRPKLGVVFLGARFHSIPGNLVVGGALGAVLTAYAYGLWKLKAWVVPIAAGYALYMPVNLTVYWFLHPEIAQDRVFFWLAYHVVLLLGFVGAGLHVIQHRDRFQ